MRSSFSEADFFQDNEAAADNTVVLSRQMRQYWGKDALKNRFVFNSPYPKPPGRRAASFRRAAKLDESIPKPDPKRTAALEDDIDCKKEARQKRNAADPPDDEVIARATPKAFDTLKAEAAEQSPVRKDHQARMRFSPGLGSRNVFEIFIKTRLGLWYNLYVSVCYHGGLKNLVRRANIKIGSVSSRTGR